MSDKDIRGCFVDNNIWLSALIESNAPDKSMAARRVLQSGLLKPVAKDPAFGGPDS